MYNIPLPIAVVPVGFQIFTDCFLMSILIAAIELYSGAFPRRATQTKLDK
jgi:hypothetical protein